MTKPAAKRTRRNGTVRCAIYTRKSSEEGLDQEFNSLQAQREACEAFIKSQRHEGWVCLPAGYDDGGFSGATMNRPLCSSCWRTSPRAGSTSWGA
jgi:site-specific DNA recombinase